MTLTGFGSRFAFVTAGALLAACSPTTLRSGLAAGTTPWGYEGRWHSSFLFGTVDAGKPYDLEQICPQGWSEVRMDVSFVQGVILVLTLFVYAPSRVSIVCANTGDGPKPLAGAGPLPPFEWVPMRPRGPLASGAHSVSTGNARSIRAIGDAAGSTQK